MSSLHPLLDYGSKSRRMDSLGQSIYIGC